MAVEEKATTQAKTAIARAKIFLSELFADEKISDLSLEEVRFEKGEWRITLGFYRPLADGHIPDILRSQLSAVSFMRQKERTYKVVTISDDTGGLIAIRNREAD